ncbi:hypothetical protein [Dyella sp. GSA-30]|uniref:hypothetical protein n=1 Tax=Dyella sp. GSA-30 TaxID=2994496 RepID=UPI002493CFB3|nr:hypothetical protein [Dyella sp. GSA-30]
MASHLACRYHPVMDTDTQLNLEDDEVALGLPLVLRGKRGAGIFAALLCAVMSGAAVWIYRDEGGWGALACAVLFALLAALSLLGRLIPASLRIDEEGFSVSSALRKGVSRRWTEIESIGLQNVGHQASIVYQVKPGVQRMRVPGGYMLPSRFEIPAPVLAQMMEACRQQFSQGG